MARQFSPLRGMSALVTGGAGFIGSNLVERLAKEGAKVRVLDNFVRGTPANLAGLKGDVEVFRGDLLDPAVLSEAVKGAEIVFHQAAAVSVIYSVQNPAITNEVNVRGTLSLLLAARDAKVRRVVFASSSSVYGANQRLPKRETLKAAPISPYAASKLAGELYCNVFHTLWGLETVSLRYFNIFGPRQSATSEYAAVIPRFISAMLRGEPPTIFGDGNQSRDFTYVGNVVTANILAATVPGAAGKVFNIGCGQRIRVNDLVDSLNGILGTNIKPRYADRRPGDVQDSWADIGRARRVLGYEPAVDFQEGLRTTVEYLRMAS